MTTLGQDPHVGVAALELIPMALVRESTSSPVMLTGGLLLTCLGPGDGSSSLATCSGRFSLTRPYPYPFPFLFRDVFPFLLCHWP